MGFKLGDRVKVIHHPSMARIRPDRDIVGETGTVVEVEKQHEEAMVFLDNVKRPQTSQPFHWEELGHVGDEDERGFKVSIATTLSEDTLLKAVIFAIQMESKGGILDKSPFDVMKKFALTHNYSEDVLQDLCAEEFEKLEAWADQWRSGQDEAEQEGP